MAINIAVVNESTVLSNEDVAAAVHCLHAQLVGDFYPYYGTLAYLFYLPKWATLPPGWWQFVFADTSDAASALGYHEKTKHGDPIGYCFAKDDIQNGYSWTVTASHELCITGDTLIPLLDGTERTVQSLLGESSFWVYSCDSDGNIKAGQAHSVRKTGSNVAIVKVTLDNGKVLRCTPDHRFMLRDGSYIEAQQLVAGQSLMPLYREVQPITENGMTYENIYNPSNDEWIFTHRMVQPHCPTGWVRHHADFNRFNNSPDNLVLMPWVEHQKVHQEHIKYYGAKWREERVKAGLPPAPDAFIASTKTAANRERIAKMALVYNRSEKHSLDMARYYTPEKRKEHGVWLGRWSRSKENLDRIAKLRASDDFKKNSKEAYDNPANTAIRKARQKEVHQEQWKDPEYQRIQNESLKKRNHKRWHMDRGLVNQSCSLCSVGALNHKVVSVKADGFSDVYDLSVHKYSNFATCAGVFIHNCEMMGDPDVLTVAEEDHADGSMTFRPKELCDAVEADDIGYTKNGPDGKPMTLPSGKVFVFSDFVLPQYWNSNAPPDAKLSFTGRVTKPLQLTRGGYANLLNVPASVQWSQVNAEKIVPAELGRDARRARLRSDWRNSTR